MSKYKIVVLESPYAGNVKENIEYARKCLKDSLSRGESVFASHLLYTQVLDDDIKEERELGISKGFGFIDICDLHVIYTDLGISRGMVNAIKYSLSIGKKVEYRKILK